MSQHRQFQSKGEAIRELQIKIEGNICLTLNIKIYFNIRVDESFTTC